MKKRWVEFMTFILLFLFVTGLHVYVLRIPDVAVVTVPEYVGIERYETFFQDMSSYFYYGEKEVKAAGRKGLAGIYEVDETYFSMNHIKRKSVMPVISREEEGVFCFISEKAAVKLFGKDIMNDDEAYENILLIEGVSVPVAGIYKMPYSRRSLVHDESVFVVGDISGYFESGRIAYAGRVKDSRQNMIAPTIEGQIKGAAVNSIYQKKQGILLWIDILAMLCGIQIVYALVSYIERKKNRKEKWLRIAVHTGLFFGMFYFLLRQGNYIDGRLIPTRLFSIHEWIERHEAFMIAQRQLEDIPYFLTYVIESISGLVKIIFLPVVIYLLHCLKKHLTVFE